MPASVHADPEYDNVAGLLRAAAVRSPDQMAIAEPQGATRTANAYIGNSRYANLTKTVLCWPMACTL